MRIYSLPYYSKGQNQEETYGSKEKWTELTKIEPRPSIHVNMYNLRLGTDFIEKQIYSFFFFSARRGRDGLGVEGSCYHSTNMSSQI